MQNITNLAVRSRYHHKTIAGWSVFLIGMIGLIVTGFFLKNKDKHVVNIVRIIAVIVIILSFVVDYVFSH